MVYSSQTLKDRRVHNEEAMCDAGTGGEQLATFEKAWD